jgi:AraC family transcriptional regulator
VHVERGANDGFVAEDVVVPQHYIAMLLSSRLRWETRLDGRVRQLDTRQGEVWVNPAHVPFSNRVAEPSEFLLLTVDPDKLLRSIEDTPVARPRGFEQRFDVDDAVLRSLMLAFMSEAQHRGANGRFFVDSLFTALAVHFARQYGAAAAPARVRAGVRADAAGGLDARRLDRAVEFLRARFAEDVALDALAEHVAMSKFHFIRRFKQSTGLSPYQYLLMLRLEEARRLVAAGDLPLAQVAAATGFADQSRFTAMSKRRFGTTPAALRRG